MMTVHTFQHNEQGFALITAIMMLFVATVMGLMVTNSADVEIMLSGAQQRYENNFNVAEAGWIHGAYWVDDLASDPDRVNTSIGDVDDDNYGIRRNFGDGSDGVLSGSPADDTLDNTPYWFQVKHIGDKRSPGNTEKYRRYTYLITSNANNSKSIEVRVTKTLKRGYN